MVVSCLVLPCRALSRAWNAVCLSLLQPPLCVSVELTVGQVAKKMAEVRTDAVILLGPQGDMKGIMTDHDVARWANVLRLTLRSRLRSCIEN